MWRMLLLCCGSSGMGDYVVMAAGSDTKDSEYQRNN